MGTYYARKLKKQKVDPLTKEEKLDLYAFSLSLFFHVISLLVMSLAIVSSEKLKPIKIELSWDSNQDLSSETEETLIDLSSENPSIVETIENAEDIQNPIDIPEISIDIPDNQIVSSSEILDMEFITEIITDVTNETESVSEESNPVIRDLIQSLSNNSARGGTLTASSNQRSDISQRLKAAGAQTGDVQISIAWNTVDDIDLHVQFFPGNGLSDQINWTNRFGRLSHGMLDVDMNANQLILDSKPVENIFWPQNSSPSGDFNVYIHFYRSWTGNRRVPVHIIVKSMGKVSEYREIAILGMNLQHIVSFSTIKRNKKF
jgi:hypothetical protein